MSFVPDTLGPREGENAAIANRDQGSRSFFFSPYLIIECTMYQPYCSMRAMLAPSEGGIASTTTISWMCSLLISILLLPWTAMPSMAQAVFEINLSEFQYSVTVSGGTLDTDDVGTVSMTLGTSSLPVSEALGLRLDLTLSADAVLPSSPLDVTVSGSWLLGNASLSQGLTVERENRVMHLYLVRNDSMAQSGHGFVLSFPLVCGANGISASSLVEHDGGVVVVENVDLRLAQSPTAAPYQGTPTEDVLPSPSGTAPTAPEAWTGLFSASPGFHWQPCHPNPTTGLLHVPLPGEGPWQLRMAGLDGRHHSVPTMVGEHEAVVELAALAPGMYVLTIARAGRVMARHHILRR